MKFTEKVMHIVTGALQQKERLNSQKEALEVQYLQHEAISGQEFKKRTQKLQEQLTDVYANVTQQLQVISSEYGAVVEKSIELDGSMLHEDAKLLQLDLKMTPHQFEALAEKHKENPLMVQLLQEYSDKHEGLYAGWLPTADAKIRAFGDFVTIAGNAIKMPQSLQAAMLFEGKLTPQICTESE